MAAHRPPRTRDRRAPGATPAARPAEPTAVVADGPAPTFADLGVWPEVCDVLHRDGIETAFPIQSATLADSLAGRDVLGAGRTGSGKTLAFVLPVLQRLAIHPERRVAGRPRAMILAPTRELARQIHETIRPLAAVLDLRSTTVFGGVPAGPQITALRRGVDIVVACPGRLEDLKGSGHVDLDAVEITVLDEADHMADLGFLPGVRRLLDATPRRGQRLLFSATLDDAVDGLVTRYLRDPVTHRAADPHDVGTTDHHVLVVHPTDRLAVLVDLTSAPGRTVVFSRTKHRARQLTRQLVASGVPAVELHGNLTQGARLRNLAAFSEGRATTLVATDIAARGIHVDDVRLVIHADPPVEHKAYVHRSGRTARAGADGTVVTLSTQDQRGDVEKLGRKAGIAATFTDLAPGHPILGELAPGPRTVHDPAALRVEAERHAPAPAGRPATGRSTNGRSADGRSGSARNGGTRSGAPRGGTARSASGRTSSAGPASRSGSSRPSGPRPGGRRRGGGGGGGAPSGRR